MFCSHFAYGAQDSLRFRNWHLTRAAQAEVVEFDGGNFIRLDQLVNRAPVARVTPQTLWLDAGQAFSFVMPTWWFSDPDPADRLTYRFLPDGAAGTLGQPSWLRMDGGTRIIAGTPPPDYTGGLHVTIFAFDPVFGRTTLPLRLAVGNGATQQGSAAGDALTGSHWSDALFGLDGPDILRGLDGHDRLDGGTGNDTLRGEQGNDRLTGGAGHDNLDGGAGNDVYVVARGADADRILNGDNAGFDELLFDDVSAPHDLWFSREGDHLVVSRNASADRVDLVGWYGSTPARIDRFVIDDRLALVAADVDRLVQAMAQFGPTPAPGSAFTPLIANPLAPVLAANWKPMA